MFVFCRKCCVAHFFCIHIFVLPPSGITFEVNFAFVRICFKFAGWRLLVIYFTDLNADLIAWYSRMAHSSPCIEHNTNSCTTQVLSSTVTSQCTCGHFHCLINIFACVYLFRGSLLIWYVYDMVWQRTWHQVHMIRYRYWLLDIAY